MAKIEAAGGTVSVLEVPSESVPAIGVGEDAARTPREPRTAAGRAAAGRKVDARTARDADVAERASEAAATSTAKAAKQPKASKVQGPRSPRSTRRLDAEATDAVASVEATDADDPSARRGGQRRRNRSQSGTTTARPPSSCSNSLLNAFRAPDIRRRILYVLAILIVFRFLAHVPVPGVDREALASFFAGNALIGVLDLISGGGLSSFSIVALGVNPYINASIIMQLMTGVVPSLQALSREGEYGRNKINQYTRYLSVPMAVLQAYGFLALLNSQGILSSGFDLGNFATLTQIATLTAGSIALMWLGELITERGIGNGISFIIFAGIVSQAPGAIAGFVATPNPALVIGFAILAIASVAVIIYIQEGQRRIPIQYASRVRGRRMYQGGQTFLPLRVNQAGVIPIIFAISILLFPAQIASYFQNSEIDIVASIAQGIVALLQPPVDPLRRALLPPGRRVHLLLHGVYVQTGRDRRAASQERRVHPGHPARAGRRPTISPGSSPGSRSPGPSSWASSRPPRRSWGCSSRRSPRSPWGVRAC